MSINQMKRIGRVAVFLCVIQSLTAEARVWGGLSETRVEGTFHKELFGGVLIKDQKGKTQLVRFEQLSKADLRYLESCVPPSVELDVDFKTRELPKTEWSREDDDTILYTFTVTVEKKSKLPYQRQLTAELFIIGDERAVESDRRSVLMHYKKMRFAFPDQKDAVCELIVPDVTFNAYRANWIMRQDAAERGKTYFGYILVILDSNGGVVSCDTDLPQRTWLAKDLPYGAEKLRELYAAHAGSCETRHFNDSFKKIAPPRIPWFQRVRNR